MTAFLIFMLSPVFTSFVYVDFSDDSRQLRSLNQLLSKERALSLCVFWFGSCPVASTVQSSAYNEFFYSTGWAWQCRPE